MRHCGCVSRAGRRDTGCGTRNIEDHEGVKSTRTCCSFAGNSDLQQTTYLLHDVSPKIRAVTENVTQISYTVREKVDEVGETVSQVNGTVLAANQRTSGQVAHV